MLNEKRFAEELARHIAALCDADNTARNSRVSVAEVQQAYEIYVLPLAEKSRCRVKCKGVQA